MELTSPYAAGPLLEPTRFAQVRRRALLECCKWDPQVGDVGTLAPFPLVLGAGEWARLAADAERLSAELLAAEDELLTRPDLWPALGVPRRLQRALRGQGPFARYGRLLRFDFHWTREGWRRLPARTGWQHLFSALSKVPVLNPGRATLTESKRFPLVWDALETALPTWRALLPETRDPRQVDWRRDDQWVMKAAYGNTGDAVAIQPLLTARERRALRLDVLLSPGQWAAQRRFEAIALETPHGPLHPCVGVFTVNGRAAGAYARASPRPLIDFAARDLAVLVQEQ